MKRREMNLSRSLAVTLANSLPLVFASPAHAQAATEANQAAEDTGGAPSGEIVVTAQRRSERLQDVGIAIAAFSGDSLRQQGVVSSTEIARLTPGINISGTYGGQSVQFSIRGVTQSDFNDAIEGPVAVYIDDTYIPSQQGQSMAIFDLERVEALKGPQGTLFGRNATGGLVHFIVAKPELGKVGGYLDLTYGRFDKTVVEGAINLPLGEKAALRASGNWSRNNSMWKNVYPAGMVTGAPTDFGPAGVSPRGQSLGDQDNLSGRLQLLLKPTDNLEIRLTGSATRQNLSESPWTSSSVLPVIDAQNRQVGAIFATPTETRAAVGPGGTNFFNPAVLPFQAFLYSPTTPGRRAPGANYFGYVPVDIQNRELSKDFALSDLNRFRAYNAGLHIDADLGDAQLTSVTSYSEFKKSFLLDADGSPVNDIVFGNKAKTKSFSQELRISGSSPGLTWVGGAYYLHINARNAWGVLGPKGSAFSLIFGVPTTGIDPLAVFHLTTESASLFGQVSYEFLPKLTVVLGGRLIHEKQTYDYSTDGYANLNDYSVDDGTTPLFPLYPAFHDNRGKTLWAGKAQLEYRADRNLLIYFGVNRGVKGGSYNGKYFDGTPPLNPAEIPYGPETLVSYEGGFKLTALDGHVTLNASAFHYDYSDYQSFVFTNLSGVVQNVDAKTDGIEAELGIRLGDLKLSANGAYVDARVKNFQIAPGVFATTRPAYTPKWSGAARADYTIPSDVIGGSLTFGAALTYQSSFYHNARNFAADKFNSRTLVDLNLTWASSSNGLEFGGFVKNLFDKRYKSVGLDLSGACGCNVEAYGEPLTWGIKAGYKF